MGGVLCRWQPRLVRKGLVAGHLPPYRHRAAGYGSGSETVRPSAGSRWMKNRSLVPNESRRCVQPDGDPGPIRPVGGIPLCAIVG